MALLNDEDPTTFGQRLKFVYVATTCGEEIPWPCLQFDSMPELNAVLQQRNMLRCLHRKHRLIVELLRHVHQGGSENDSVVFLFGDKTPGGNRILFTDQTKDYKEHIADAVDRMGMEPVFMEALNETSPILGDLLAEEHLKQPFPRPGEHAPAA